MNSKLANHRALLSKKRERLTRLQQEVEGLEQLVHEEENTEIVDAVRSLCLGPEELTQFLRQLRQEGEPSLAATEEQQKNDWMEEEPHEAYNEQNGNP